MKENPCDGCCYKKHHNGDLTKCNYLTPDQHCLINEHYVYEIPKPTTKRS